MLCVALVADCFGCFIGLLVLLLGVLVIRGCVAAGVDAFRCVVFGCLLLLYDYLFY